jgi:lysine-specific demethylase 8
MNTLIHDAWRNNVATLNNSAIHEAFTLNLRDLRQPRVFRGLAQHWPAITHWDFEYLAQLDPTRQVNVVVGNREQQATLFAQVNLGDYFLQLATKNQNGDTPHYLKEFDLLEAFPKLRSHVYTEELFPASAITSNQVWVGPAQASTGLHYDYLDNLAILLKGKKRFYLAPPGTIEKLGKLSKKYDRWAKLADMSIHEVTQFKGVYSVDLNPGDVLFVPKHWWHEVVNIEASILLSGFFGPRIPVFLKWLQTACVQRLHELRLCHTSGCTCHQI